MLILTTIKFKQYLFLFGFVWFWFLFYCKNVCHGIRFISSFLSEINHTYSQFYTFQTNYKCTQLSLTVYERMNGFNTIWSSCQPNWVCKISRIFVSLGQNKKRRSELVQHTTAYCWVKTMSHSIQICLISFAFSHEIRLQTEMVTFDKAPHKMCKYLWKASAFNAAAAKTCRNVQSMRCSVNIHLRFICGHIHGIHYKR